MKKILNYVDFVLNINHTNENNLTISVNEEFDLQKSFMDNIHRDSYNKLIKRILGGTNTNLETIVKSEDYSRLPDFKASLIFNYIWKKIERITNPSITDFPASVFQNLQSLYLSDLGILETLSVKFSDVNLKEPKYIVKLASEGKLVDAIKVKGEYDKLTDSQKRVLDKINNKKEFVEDLKNKLYNDPNKPYDSKLGLDPTQLYMYELTPGFKLLKSSKSDAKPEEIGNYIIRDICILAYTLYVEGLANTISKHVVDEKTATSLSQDQLSTSGAVTKTSTGTKKKVLRSQTETSQSTFNPDNLKNFGY
jgi:hypothetical protein